MVVETCCPLILVTILLLVVKYSTTLSVVTGLVVVWVSLTIDTKLLGCDTTKMFGCLWGELFTITAENDFETVGIKPTNKLKLCQIILATVHDYVLMYIISDQRNELYKHPTYIYIIYLPK